MDKVVAVFDVLGFKNRLNREGLPAVRIAYNALRNVVNKIGPGMMLNAAVPIEGGKRVAAFGTFDVDHDLRSDSIFVWCTYSSFTFPPFCGLLLDFFCDVLELRIPLRAGIAVGEADMDKSTNTFLGAPLNEAASVEGAQNWIGVSFGPSFSKEPYNWFEPDQALVYRKHRKLENADIVPGAVLDWPRKWWDTRKSSPNPIIQQMNIVPEFSRYYDNTLEFVAYSEANKNWYYGDGSISTS